MGSHASARTEVCCGDEDARLTLLLLASAVTNDDLFATAVLCPLKLRPLVAAAGGAGGLPKAKENPPVVMVVVGS